MDVRLLPCASSQRKVPEPEPASRTLTFSWAADQVTVAWCCAMPGADGSETAASAERPTAPGVSGTHCAHRTVSPLSAERGTAMASAGCVLYRSVA